MPSNSRMLALDINEPLILVAGKSTRAIEEWKKTNIVGVANNNQLSMINGYHFDSVYILQNAGSSWIDDSVINYLNQKDPKLQALARAVKRGGGTW